MWIVGGETFSYSHHLDMVAIFSPDLNNQDGQGLWTPVHAKGEKGPSPRYGHSAVIHDDKVKEIQCLTCKQSIFSKTKMNNFACILQLFVYNAM